MADIAITTDELTKRFGDLTAVDRVSFEVRKGEIFGFLGPNGAGKSTTIRMLCTLTRPTSGTATVDGFDIVKEDGKVRERIGLVAEKLIMYDELTARENLLLFGRLYDIPSADLKGRIDDLLTVVQMEKWADERIQKFSTGMKQRINVIRALVNRPDILFLDEPTLGLDPQSTAEIRDFIRRTNRKHGTTMILTTHLMVEADMVCDRIGIIDKGKVVALDTPRGLKKLVTGTGTTVLQFDIPNLTEDMVASVARLDPVASAVREGETLLKAHVQGGDAFGAIVDAVRGNGGRIQAGRDLEPSLEDVFLKLTGRHVRDELSDRGPANGRRQGGGPHGRRTRSRVR